MNKERAKNNIFNKTNGFFEKTDNFLLKNVGPYVLGKTLGQGTFGKVKIGTHNVTGEKVAVKILEKRKIYDKASKKRVDREIKIFKQLYHRNVIQLYEIIQTKTSLYLIMEFLSGGELYEYINAKKRLNEKEALKFFQQIVSGLEYIHQLNISHRDLKPENLLIDSKRNLKIVDFGLSNIYKEDEYLKTPCGSPCYAPPEMIAGKIYSGRISDIWSIGIILFTMICGYLPFDEEDNYVLYKKILEGKYEFPDFISESAKDLIRNILNIDPSTRYSLEQIKQHSWFNELKYNSIQGILVTKHIIPIDITVLNKLKEFDIDREEAKQDILLNKHNKNTSTYYLLLKKHLRKGNFSVADLYSKDYLEYINNPISLLESNLELKEKILEELGDKKKIMNSECKDNKQNRLESEGSVKNTKKSLIKKEIFKKINLSKLQFAKTFNFSKKTDVNKEKWLKKERRSNSNLNPKKIDSGRGYVNTSKNYECNLTEERNFSHEVKKNNKEKPVLKKIMGKLNLTKKFQIIKRINNTDPNSYEDRRYLKTFGSKHSITVIRETEENEKTLSKLNFIPTILKRENKLIHDKMSKNQNTIRRFLLSNNVNHLENSPPNLSTIRNISNSVKENSLRLKNIKNSQDKCGKKPISNSTIISNKIGNKSFSKINISNLNTNYLNTKEANSTKNNNILLKNIRLPSSSKKHNFSKQNSYKVVFNNKHKTAFPNEKNKVERNKSTTKKQDNKITTYQGPLDISLISNKDFNQVSETIEKALNFHKVTYKFKESKFNCIFNNLLKFDLVICNLHYFPGVYYIKFQKLVGTNNNYDEIAQKLLYNIRSIL